LAERFANPSSVHKPGQDARTLVDAARERGARALGCGPREVIFTSGGTEADALAILGTRPRKVVTTAVEHPAVLAACEAVGEAVRVPVFASGELDLEALRRALPGASLCSAMAVNNETGVIFPIREIAALCREHGVPLHVDAVQAAGRIPLDFPWDLLALSAHKISGPKGAGLLAARRKVSAVQGGGHQERGRRGGTENVAGIAGMGKAFELATAQQPAIVARLGPLRDRLEAAARELPGARVAGSTRPRTTEAIPRAPPEISSWNGSSALANSCAVWNRAAGLICSAWCTTSPSPGGMSGRRDSTPAIRPERSASCVSSLSAPWMARWF